MNPHTEIIIIIFMDLRKNYQGKLMKYIDIINIMNI